jgi:hypothetical protein
MRVVSVFLLALLVSLPVLAVPAGTASGKYTVNEDTVEIRNAVAVPWTNKDDGRTGVKVVLSDVPIGDDAVSRTDMGFDPGDKPGEVKAIEFILYPEEGADSGTIYHPGLKDYTFSKSGGVEFTSEAFDENTVAGRLFMAEPDDFFGQVYFFDVTFRAPISKKLDASGGPPAGTATGVWKVNDESTALRYAYAVARRNFEDEPEKFYVVLSENEIPVEKLQNSFGLMEYRHDKKFRALEFELSQEKGIEGSQLFHDAFENGSISASGSAQFQPRVFDGKTISGRLYMTKISEFFGAHYFFSGGFQATIQRKPPPTFSGAAAAASPPGKAVVAFIRAVRAKNKVAIKSMITPEMAADLDGPNGAQMMDFLNAMFEPGSQVVAVYQKDDKAEVVVMARMQGGKSSQKIPVQLIDGKWTLTKQ